ncbi:MAG: RluA family pseudouridine synthase [Spirochaetales bacterium]|nr:RluA family pseudouridine synthase [Spirochaetales bacterium]
MMSVTRKKDHRRFERNIRVSEKESGQTLIDLLTSRFTYLTRKKWQDHIKTGRLLVNQGRSEQEIILRINDLITFFPDSRPEPEVNKTIEILYQDDDLILVNKPPNLPCHPGGIYLYNTLWGILKERYDEFYLVNRLDRETSGIIGVAKTRKAARFYFWEMKERRIEKEYLVLVEGVFPEKLSAKGWLAADGESPVYKKRLFLSDPSAFEEGDNGDRTRQFAHTEFTRQQVYNECYSLLACKPLTGKTHQIRATLHSLGFPVVGDKLYGIDPLIFIRFPSDTMTKEDWENLKMSHQALHCRRMVFPLSQGGNVCCEASLPDSWAPLIRAGSNFPISIEKSI